MVRSCMRQCIVCVLVVMGSATMMACGDNNDSNNTPPKQTMDMVDMDMAPDLPVDMPDLGTFDQTPSCDPLVLNPQMAYATTHQLISFDASGGSGTLRFELKENLSGAIINDLTGAYLAGLSPGVTDVVRLVDDVCKTDLEATVAVVESMEVSPREIELKPGQSFTFEIGKGSGEFTYAFISNISGASVTDQGVYTAGNKAGKDRVEVIDARTGESVEATVTVSPDVVFEATPAQVVVPVGQQYEIKTRGGSNVVDVTVQGNMVSVSDGILTANMAGTTTLTLRDHFTGQETPLVVTAVAAQSFEQRPGGEFYSIDRVIGNVDINGDGHLDAVLAHPEAHGSAYRSGAVFIYEGSAQGLKTTPVRTLNGNGREEEFGHDAFVTDVTGDGLPDLIVGARRADLGAAFGGAVFVYPGQAGKFFADEPSYTWSGEFGSDEMGYSVTACDFNKDGHTDIAVGMWQGEDRNAQPVRFTQGAIKVFLGYPEGFLPKPDIVIHGKQPDANNNWVNTANTRLGESLAAGDFDGDGYCDLAAGTQFVASPNGGSNSGAVFIYRGRPADNFGPGGLALNPSWAVRYDNADSQGARFGRRIAMGDFNNDQKADLAVGAYAYREGASTQRGAILVYAGQTLPEVAAGWSDYTNTMIALKGDGTSDQFGWDVNVGDLNGDGIDDLLAPSPADEMMGGPSGAGVVHVHYGSAQGLKDTPDLEVGGLVANDRLGQGVAVAGDLDKDGQRDLLAFSARADRLGLEVGELYAFYAKDWTMPAALDMDVNPSGARVGNSVTFVPDVNGDGQPEMVVGAPYYTIKDSTQLQQGAVFIYPSNANGFAAEPAQTLAGFYTNSTADRFGWAVSSAGDFNNDGIPDLAVVAITEDRPANYNASQYATNTCSGPSRGDSGAVYIFLGTAQNLFESDPAFIVHGREVSDQIRAVAGGMDINGDGFDDVVYGSYLWDGSAGSNTGGYAVLYGRAATAGKITPICDPDLFIHGDRANGFLGWSVSAAGDLDKDGCDEFVVGARDHSQGAGTQGQVRVVFGWGAACQGNSPRQVAFAPGLSGSRAGTSVAGGLDVDGDNTPDVVVGGMNYRVGTNSVGAAWLLSGALVSALPREAVTTNAAVQTLNGFTLGNRTEPDLLTGSLSGELFGTSVALVPGLGPNQTAGIAVGSPLSDVSGMPQSGGVLMYTYENNRLNTDPVAVFAGESVVSTGRLGETCAATSFKGKPHVGMGGYRANSVGLDQGAAFVAPLQ